MIKDRNLTFLGLCHGGKDVSSSDGLHATLKPHLNICSDVCIHFVQSYWELLSNYFTSICENIKEYDLDT